MRTAACCLLAGLLGAAGFTAPGAIPARHGANRVAAPQLVTLPGRRDALASAVAASAVTVVSVAPFSEARIAAIHAAASGALSVCC